MPNCSFCSRSDHNIANCNSPNIVLIYDSLFTIYYDIVNNYNQFPIQPITSQLNFTQTVCRRFRVNELKVVARRCLNYRGNARKFAYATLLWDHFNNPTPFPIVERPQEQQPLNIIEPPQEEQEQNISWRIDRRPRFGYWALWTSPQIDLFSLIFDDQDFTPIQTCKKYPIRPIMLCTETLKELEEQEECGICLELINTINFIDLGCNHKFCETCIKTTLESHTTHTIVPCCALCRAPMKSFTIKNPETFNNLEKYCL